MLERELGELLLTLLDGTLNSATKAPIYVDRNSDWFWEHDWQARERAANTDLQRKAFKEFATIEELIHSLMIEGIENCKVCKDDPNPAQALTQALRHIAKRGF